MGEKKKLTKVQLRKRTQKAQRGLRWVIQIGFLIAAPGAFSACFNGAKYIAGQIGGLQALEPTAFLLLLVGLCAFTVLFGRFFCGYACAFGTLGDAVHLLFTPLRLWYAKHFPTKEVPAHLRRGLRLIKVAVLVAILALCFVGSYASWWSPWTAFAGFTGGSLDGISVVAFALLGAIVLGMGLVDRFFCQFLCPLGAIFSFLPTLPLSHFKRNPQACAAKCGRCRKACPMHMYPEADGLEMGDCITCGQCATACPLDNVSVLAAGTKPNSEKKGGMRFKGTHPIWVIARAAVLLSLLWFLGAVRW